MGRRHRRIFAQHGIARREGNGLSDSGFAYSNYWPLTIVPQASRPKRLKPRVIMGALTALSAALIFAFRHGIHAW